MTKVKIEKWEIERERSCNCLQDSRETKKYFTMISWSPLLIWYNSLHHSVESFCYRYLLRRWNKALWLDVPSHVTSFNQSERFISVSYATIKFDMTSSPTYKLIGCQKCLIVTINILGLGYNTVRNRSYKTIYLCTLQILYRHYRQ